MGGGGGLFAESSWREALRRVLHAYCFQVAPGLGYVQGMSYLAAVLLMQTDATRVNVSAEGGAARGLYRHPCMM